MGAVSLPPNPEYTKDAEGVVQRVKEASEAMYGACQMRPRYIYLGVAERNILTMANGHHSDKLLGLPIVPVALSSWLKDRKSVV